MPPYIPGVNTREVIRLLRRLNCSESEGGSDTVFRHEWLGLAAFAPRNSGDVDPVTMGSILVQIGLTLAEFDEARRRRGRIPERFQE